jgi:hypothetical protein
MLSVARPYSLHAATGTSTGLCLDGTELPAQVAAYRRELDATPPDQNDRRERLEWQIRRVRNRMADVEARLAKIGAEGGL